ncbi:uncharacterized protein LOC143528712 [Brachyhypopomus gauderio]|uniref:uncharacterized protein LOC143528712 n=1 Tax=Brachyhypopomus gauderio TaxID=698409 RepID=UPI004040F3DD
MKYRRILPVKSLKDVENPWKGITLNRCILAAMAIVMVSSTFEMVQETLEPLFEAAEEVEGSGVQDTLDESEGSWWDGLAFWNWRPEDEMGQFGKRPPGVKPKGIRKSEMQRKGLLKERD